MIQQHKNFQTIVYFLEQTFTWDCPVTYYGGCREWKTHTLKTTPYISLAECANHCFEDKSCAGFHVLNGRCISRRPGCTNTGGNFGGLPDDKKPKYYAMATCRGIKVVQFSYILQRKNVQIYIVE